MMFDPESPRTAAYRKTTGHGRPYRRLKCETELAKWVSIIIQVQFHLFKRPKHNLEPVLFETANGLGEKSNCHVIRLHPELWQVRSFIFQGWGETRISFYERFIAEKKGN